MWSCPCGFGIPRPYISGQPTTACSVCLIDSIISLRYNVGAEQMQLCTVAEFCGPERVKGKGAECSSRAATKRLIRHTSCIERAIYTIFVQILHDSCYRYIHKEISDRVSAYLRGGRERDTCCKCLFTSTESDAHCAPDNPIHITLSQKDPLSPYILHAVPPKPKRGKRRCETRTYVIIWSQAAHKNGRFPLSSLPHIRLQFVTPGPQGPQPYI